MALSSHETYYELLGITQQANVKEIRDAYHRLALKCHPDKDPCNPRAVAAFQNLSAAYETLSNEHYRRKYDAILSSSQRAKQSPQPAWPPQKSSDPSVATRMWQETMRSRAWDWTSRAQERANQARREDDEYWSGPTYFHGATDRNGRGEQRNPMQKDRYSSEHYERQREARNEARKGAEKIKSDTRTSPPKYPFDRGTGEFNARADNHKEQQEAWGKAERDRREDDGYRGKPPSPQYPDPDWSDKVQKEYQERLKRAKKERSSHRKAERKQSEKKWPAELLLLLSKIISIQADIEKTGAMVGKSKRAMKDERKDQDQEYIFELAIKRKSLERRLKECLDEYKRIAKLMRDRGREQEANEADVKLREARKTAARNERTARKETEQASSKTETHTKGKSKSDQAQPSTKNEGSMSDQRLTTPQAARPYGGKRTEAEQPPRMTLPKYDGQNDERPPSEYVAIPRVSYDGSDPDRGFTEETPEPSVAGEDNEYDDDDYDPPFCNDFHDSHLEVHRGFWDIIDSEHECNFCHKVYKRSPTNSLISDSPRRSACRIDHREDVQVNSSEPGTSSTILRIRLADLTMEPYDLLVINGLVVTASDIGHYDIAIKHEKIALLAPKASLTGIVATRVIDAEGGYVMPGGVDAHIHLDEPPLFGKGKSADDYETGTRSAICGGTTTVVTFAPQSKSDPALLPVLQQTHMKANQNCYTDYSFHLLISNPTPSVLSKFPALRERGVSSLKIYMTYEALQLRDNQILDVLLEARRNGITTLIHAENGDILSWMTKQLETRGLYAPKYHATSRPQVVETEATNRAIALSSIIDTPILIVHVSSPSAAVHIRQAQTQGLPIYAETCPQYLFLTRSDLDKPGFEGAKCVCSPPPREGSEDHEAIWRGLANGTFTILSSDHCPFVYDDGERGKKSVLSEEYPEGRFRYIPNGCPGVETRLPLVLCEGVKRLGLSKFVEVTSTNAAKLYGLYPQKGALLPGLSDADLCIWYPPGKLEPFGLTNGQLHHQVDYTPYEGREVGNWPRWTILRGRVMWARDEGGVVGEKGLGKFIKRGESGLARGEGRGDWEVEGF